MAKASKSPWTIYSVNNATGKVTMQHEDGRQFDAILPSDHRAASLARAYLQTLTDAQDASITVQTPPILETILPTIKQIKLPRIPAVWIAIAVEALGILFLLLRGK